jgi:hypothetical protein
MERGFKLRLMTWLATSARPYQKGHKVVKIHGSRKYSKTPPVQGGWKPGMFTKINLIS